MSDTPEHSVVDENIYALVADIRNDPGGCALYRLKAQTPSGFLATSPDAPEDAEPVPLAHAHVVTRSHDLARLGALKKLLDDAWSGTAEAMRTHAARCDDIQQTYGGRTNIDVEGVLAASKRHARNERIRIWSFIVERLSTLPVLPDLTGLVDEGGVLAVDR